MSTVLVIAAPMERRRQLEAALRGRPGLRLVDAPSTDTPARQAETARPDVVVLDLGRQPLGPGGAGAAAVRAVVGSPGAPAVVVLAEHAGGTARAEARRSGARGVLPRTASAGEIAAAVAAVAAGLVVLHPDVVASPRPASADTPSASGEPLSAREREVLALLAEGLGNKAIAARLGISSHTVKFHVAAILDKLGAGTRAEAVTVGVRRGLLLI